MPAISNDWAPELKPEYKKEYYKELFNFVGHEYATREIFPPADDIFNAFHLTPLSKVKCVIIGQDPYHNVGQAHGLSFSVKPGVDIPPSLANIYQELHDDLGCYIPNNGYLVKWAEQGVLMLNAVLTVRAHQANSHQGHGWEQLIGWKLEFSIFCICVCIASLKCIKRLICSLYDLHILLCCLFGCSHEFRPV